MQKTFNAKRQAAKAQGFLNSRFNSWTSPDGAPNAIGLVEGFALFVSEEATLGQAAEIAGQTQATFLKELGACHIPLHSGLGELAEDLKVVESFRR